ncbi:antennal protein 10 isoform 2-T2 [Cochliomyia hominivorax]
MSQFIYLLALTSLFASIEAIPHPPATTAAPLKQTYDNKFDNIDIDEILGQERLLNNYIKCLEGLGPCTPDGKMLKEFSNFRDSAGRYNHQLRQMYRTPEIRFGQGDSLSYRQSSRGLDSFRENLRSGGLLSHGLSYNEGEYNY